MNPVQASASFQQAQYGTFRLTDAIRPSPRHPIIPQEGYRLETFRDEEQGLTIPVLAASVSREKLFDCFLDLIGQLDDVVDVILETSHDGTDNHRDLSREEIDLPVLQSHLFEYEDLLLNDGCTGIAVLCCSQPIEIQFDEHKLLYVYAEDPEPFKEVMQEYGICLKDDLQLITEGEHLHNSAPHHLDQFEQMCFRLGVGEMAEHVNW